MNNNQKKILFMPFLQIPSGHHQVANNLIEILEQSDMNISCEKIDILAYSYGRIEKLVSSIYLKWIKVFPKIYNIIYEKAVHKNNEREKRYFLYEFLFLHFMKKLLEEKQPDFIICTHSLPAYMLNHLKEKGNLQVPVINVYTDYFIHRFWGIKHIDLHLVPTNRVKNFLLERGVSENRIIITGIPVNREIKQNPERHLRTLNNNFLTLLVAGGNLGVGALTSLIEKFKSVSNMKLYVLCGKNKRLYNRVKSLQLEHIIPLPYINCMREMNILYDQVDAIITKPGGVTISECLYKKIPIFIYHSLPGQERINLYELKKEGLIFRLKKDNIYEQIQSILAEETAMEEYKKRLEAYHSHINEKWLGDIVKELLEREHTYKNGRWDL